MPEKFSINDNMIELPASREEAPRVTVLRGPNIKPIPVGVPPESDLSCEIILKVGDNITTDHIMPAGAKILPYRSNVPKLSEFSFTVVDESFPKRAKEKGGGVIVGGENYGQGSSREHAALVPLYLGIKAVVAKSFARIHASNLINFGIVPLTFASADDYDRIGEGDEVYIKGFENAIKNDGECVLVNAKNDTRVCLKLNLTDRQRAVLLSGGLLNYTKNNSRNEEVK